MSNTAPKSPQPRSLQLESLPHNAHSFNATLIVPSSEHSPIATVSYHTTKEQGDITLAATQKTLHISHALGSGVWRLRTSPDSSRSSETRTLAQAVKKQFWRRNFCITLQGKSFALVPTRAERSDYELYSVPCAARISGRDVDGVVVARLTALAGPEQRRPYRMVFDEDVPIELIAFCFWLVNLMNMRHSTASQAALLWGA